jgi:hypothetical protein
VRKLISLLLAAWGGGELTPGRAVISGAQHADVSLPAPVVNCCPLSLQEAGCPACTFTTRNDTAGINISIPVEARLTTYTEANTPRFDIQCYRADVAPSSPQLGMWDVEPGKQGRFTLTVSERRDIVPGNPDIQRYKVRGRIHVECEPQDKYANPASGTVYLDAEF